ncbi:hypothetical protein BGX23_005386 [Mortierella sp. AD031]|nr:hypothetical protein BGX23_005386 [Mortierella sp. AD031]
MPASGKQTPTPGGARRKPTQSTNNNTASNNANPELGSKSGDTEGYTPVNNFNSQDVVNHFDRSWKAALDSFHQPGATGTAKAEMYKGSETMAWGSKVAAKGSTSTGTDFLAELKRKQPVAP